MHQVLLHQGNERQQVAGEGLGAVEPRERSQQCGVGLGQDLTHDHRFLESVEKQAMGVRPVIPEQSSTEAVEGRYPRLPVVVSQTRVDPRGQLTRCSGREREHEDLTPIRDAAADGLLVEVGERVGLTCAGSGEDATRTV